MSVASLDGKSLSIQQAANVARHLVQVELMSQAQLRVETSREVAERLLSEHKAVHGITTGFALSGTLITPEGSAELQRHLIRSHLAGVGAPSEKDVVRAMMLRRANTLVRGHSGIRLDFRDTSCSDQPLCPSNHS